MAEILHIEILRKHGQTHTQTDRQTDMGITIPRPPPMGGEVMIIIIKYCQNRYCLEMLKSLWFTEDCSP